MSVRHFYLKSASLFSVFFRRRIRYDFNKEQSSSSSSRRRRFFRSFVLLVMMMMMMMMTMMSACGASLKSVSKLGKVKEKILFETCGIFFFTQKFFFLFFCHGASENFLSLSLFGSVCSSFSRHLFVSLSLTLSLAMEKKMKKRDDERR